MKADGENLEARWSRNGTAAAACCCSHSLSKAKGSTVPPSAVANFASHSALKLEDHSRLRTSLRLSLALALALPSRSLWLLRSMGSTALCGQARISSQPKDEIERFRRRRALKCTLQFGGVALAW